MKCSVKRCQLFRLRGENPTGGAFVLQWTVKLQPFVIQRTSLSNAAEVAVEVRRLLSIRLHFPSESSARFFAGHGAADAGSRKRAKAPAESRSSRCRQAARFLSEALHLDARYLLRDHSARRRRAVPLVFTSCRLLQFSLLVRGPRSRRPLEAPFKAEDLILHRAQSRSITNDREESIRQINQIMT